MNPLDHLRAGDMLLILLAALATVWLTVTVWHGDTPRRAVVKSAGRIVADLPLDRPQRLTVAGPLGDSVIEIEPRRARVSQDPSPRQLCVRQGWLARAGDVAICLPNQLSIELVGQGRRFDSLAY